MKISAGKIAAAAALLICIFSVGFFLGRNHGDGSVTIHTQRQVSRALPETETAEASDNALIDLNRAETSELEMLPGIGEVLAERIIRYREQCGGFTSVDQLTEVEGIGKSRLQEIRSLITVSQSKDQEEMP